tara:strand:- start:501 stop:668 length:168 start_codon:yes stop_codon:yes gene_type:complete
MAEEEKEEETIYEKVDLGYFELPSREDWEDNMSDSEKEQFVVGIIEAMAAGKSKS